MMDGLVGAGGAGRLAGLLADPGYLLHGFDPEADAATFLPVEMGRLRQAGFIDGRTALADGAPVRASGLSEAPDPGDCASPRYIFHGAFCGSTLLARLVDAPGRTLVLREPQVLGELADRKLDPRPARIGLGRLCVLASASLFRPRQAGERVVVKPSNWVNNLLPELCDAGPAPRAVFIEAELQGFLRAVFRGGSDRMKFVAEAAWRLSRGAAADEALIERAAKDAASAGARAGQLAVVLHALQRRRFAAARERAGWARTAVVRREMLSDNPLQAARLTDVALALDLDDEVLAAAARSWSGRHAKDAAVGYTAQGEAAADQAVTAQFGADFRQALAWAERLNLLES